MRHHLVFLLLIGSMALALPASASQVTAMEQGRPVSPTPESSGDRADSMNSQISKLLPAAGSAVPGLPAHDRPGLPQMPHVPYNAESGEQVLCKRVSLYKSNGFSIRCIPGSERRYFQEVR